MKKQYYYPGAIIGIGIVFGIVGWFIESTSLRWIFPAFGLGLIATGLGLFSFMTALHTEKKVTELGEVLISIEDLATGMKEEITERSNPGPPIIASLQALTQSYMDSLNKKNEEDSK